MVVETMQLNSSTEASIQEILTNTSASTEETKSATLDCIFQPPNPCHLPTRRLRVSDINVSRYDEEFVEIEEIASGVFGKVMVARHRLDGMVYAIKVSGSFVFEETYAPLK